MLHEIVMKIVEIVGSLGYPGIVALMFLESTFFPFPSEVVVTPAGYLAAQGQMSLWLVIVTGIIGSLLGALFNYWLSCQFGRPLFERYGKYFLVTPAALDKADAFFANHGHISTFIGRLLPGIRQLISLPAGVARMNIPLFCFFTSLGAGIWVVVLALVGYWVGYNEDLVKEYTHLISIVLIVSCVLLAAGYILYVRRKRAR